MTIMLGRTAASRALSAGRRPTRMFIAAVPRRSMGGGGHYMHVDEGHKAWGEAFGVVCWLWVFHRARHDLPVFLGLRHPWEHAEDPFMPHAVHAAVGVEATDRLAAWDKFSTKALVQSEEDDDDDEDEEEEEDDEGEDEDE